MTTSLPISSQNLIITGYDEPNKPRIARQVAEQLRMRFLDVQQLVEDSMGDDVTDIRSSYGERRLKAIEAEVMEDVLLYRSTIIRINGSTLARNDHYDRLRQTGVVICLVARLDAILQRMHLALGARYHDPGERAIAIGELQREWAIRGRPGLREMDVTYADEPEIISQLVALWRQLGIERG